MSRLWARVEGRVQGVGFRYFVLSRARALSLGGWVRNVPDGAVEVLAEGPRPDLEKLRDHLLRGPAAARVLKVDEHWTEAEPEHPAFDVRY